MTPPFARNIKAIRERFGLNQDEFANKLSVSRQTVVRWETGKADKPRQKEITEAICTSFDVTEQDLFGFSDGFYAKQYGLEGRLLQPVAVDSTAPVLGSIAAGDPSAAIEWSCEEHYVDPRVKERYPEGFFLIVRGDSMNLVLPDGCYAYVAQIDVNSGDIAAVKVNGDEATVKLVKFLDEIVVLEPQSTNPEHKKRIIDKDDPDSPYVRILGRVVWYDYELVSL